MENLKEKIEEEYYVQNKDLATNRLKRKETIILYHSTEGPEEREDKMGYTDTST